MTRVRLRIYLGDAEHKLGPGKIELLEAVRAEGSISAAARALGMAYRHAWELVDDLNRSFDVPVVEAGCGGRSGGGARVTAFGEELIERFRRMERAARAAVRGELRRLDAHVARGRRAARR